MRLETLCDDTQRETKKLDLEFSELYDKVSRLMSRMARRYAHDQKEAGDGKDPDPETSHLDSLDPISKSIMLRRAGIGKDT